jgi:predicted signal transduction protein with EAL and GGDEF domain
LPAVLALLAVASLIAPAILAYQVWRHQVTDGVAIAVGSMTLFLLVVTRMAQLLRQIERQSKQLSQLTRVDELTGLPNRRAWSAELPAAIERARRDRVALSVAYWTWTTSNASTTSTGTRRATGCSRPPPAATASWRRRHTPANGRPGSPAG